MNKSSFFAALTGVLFPAAVCAETIVSPDGKLAVDLTLSPGGTPMYEVKYNGVTMLEPSPLGLVTDFTDFTGGLTVKKSEKSEVERSFPLSHSKTSKIDFKANSLTTTYTNPQGYTMDIEMVVADNDVAFRYRLPRQKGLLPDGKESDTRGSARIMKENTGFRIPADATSFLSPQSDPMIGWKRTKPSYEEEYKADVPLTTPSQYGHGYTFPGLFRVGDNGWVLVSETGVDSRYAGSRLGEYTDGVYMLEFPMPGENNGNGTSEPAFALPGATPWRTLTVGDNLAPIVETQIPWALLDPRFEASQVYEPGKGTWSWILWQDNSINEADQMKFIDLAAEMGFPYVLIDNWWDTNIGREGMKRLADYGRSKGVDLLVWFSSSGYWNDIEQGPINLMDNSINRKKTMDWLREIGAKGIKVDFFGGDKQETMRLYEEILSDANDRGLMVIFHGCTLPRGWERLYPNYIGSEAVLASENMVFQQHFCDMEAFNATLHPFIRNTVGSMEFGGTFLNKRLNRNNHGGSERRTSDVFELATAVIFQNPAQNFAIAPNNLTDAPKVCLDFLREVPVAWDETKFVDGYPGKYAVIARRSGDKWYVAGINATAKTMKLDLSLPFITSPEVELYQEKPGKAPEKVTARRAKNGMFKMEIPPLGGTIIAGK